MGYAQVGNLRNTVSAFFTGVDGLQATLRVLGSSLSGAQLARWFEIEPAFDLLQLS